MLHIRSSDLQRFNYFCISIDLASVYLNSVAVFSMVIYFNSADVSFQFAFILIGLLGNVFSCLEIAEKLIAFFVELLFL